MRRYGKFAAALIAIWIVAVATIWWSRGARPSPESISRYLREHPIATVEGNERDRMIEKTADQLNSLSFEERRKVHETGEVRQFFLSLTPDEQARFLDMTLPEGFRQIMAALNKMESSRRKKLVERAVEDIRDGRPEGAPGLDDTQVQKIISQGVESFYKDANAEVKLDFAPVLEELQRATQSLR